MFFHEISQKGSIKGTPGYMAPEQIDKTLGARDKRTDTYALGGILFALLTGKTPVAGRTPEDVFDNTVAGRISWADLKPNHVPAALEAVVRKALARNPKNRYQSVTALRQDIHAFLGGFATSAENAGFFRNMFLLTRRYKAASGLAGLLFLLSFFFMAYFYNSEKEARRVLNMYESAKEYHIQYQQDSLDELIEQAQSSMDRHGFNKALTYLQQVTDMDPENQEAWDLKGECYFYLQDFNASEEAFSHGSDSSENPLFRLARKYGKFKPDDATLSYDELLTLLPLLSVDQQRLIFSKVRFRYGNFDDYMQLVRYMLQLTNPDMKEYHLAFTNENDLVSIDLSNNKDLKNLYALKGLPLVYLNVENTKVSQNQARHLDDMPMKTLNVAGTEIRNFKFLRSLPDIETIIVSKDRFSKNKLNSIRKYATLIEKPQINQ